MIKKAVQQIMIGSVCKTEENTLKVLNSIKSAGYDSIELNGFMIKPTPFIVRVLTKAAGMPTGSAGKFDWKSLVKESGLEVCSIHEDLGSIENDIDSVINEAHSFNTKNIVVTGMYRFAYNDKNEVKKLVQRLNKAGEELKKNDINLLYHNHNVEFVHFDNQQSEYLQNCPYSLLRKSSPTQRHLFQSYPRHLPCPEKACRTRWRCLLTAAPCRSLRAIARR